MATLDGTPKSTLYPLKGIHGVAVARKVTEAVEERIKRAERNVQTCLFSHLHTPGQPLCKVGKCSSPYFDIIKVGKAVSAVDNLISTSMET